MLQHFVHYFLHFAIIAFFAYAIDKHQWRKYYVVLLATMVIDIDHLWATPIFEANRCSINFHTFHSYGAGILYLVGCIVVKNKIIKVFLAGLLFHLFTDALDCLWSNSWDLEVLL